MNNNANISAYLAKKKGEAPPAVQQMIPLDRKIQPELINEYPIPQLGIYELELIFSNFWLFEFLKTT